MISTLRELLSLFTPAIAIALDAPEIPTPPPRPSPSATYRTAAMPKPIPAEETSTRPTLRAAVAEQIKKLRPGEVYIIRDWANELGVTDVGLARVVPPQLLAVRHIKGRTRALRVVLCPKDIPPPRK